MTRSSYVYLLGVRKSVYTESGRTGTYSQTLFRGAQAGLPRGPWLPAAWHRVWDRRHRQEDEGKHRSTAVTLLRQTHQNRLCEPSARHAHSPKERQAHQKYQALEALRRGNQQSVWSLASCLWLLGTGQGQKETSRDKGGGRHLRCGPMASTP
ncbi:hypothetical protein GQ54DRAFT_188933 [Martensiomyces pterosporus]|nr:hypothetical protein GQ54DRAFT_188933 [Martensiomyces pterosporus]